MLVRGNAYTRRFEEDPLYIERIIKEEIVTDLQNGIPYFEFHDCSSVDDDCHPITADIGIKLEEKFKIAIDKVHSSHYKHFIHLYCTKCQSTSDVHFRKSRTCKNGKCTMTLKYQCILCGNLFKHYTSAYMHVKKNNCEKSNETVKSEIKTEFITKSSKKYNPYNNKIKTNKIRKNTCPKCFKTCKSGPGFAIHLRYCGLEPKIKCEYCAYKCKLEFELMRHMKKHVKLEYEKPVQTKILEKPKGRKKIVDSRSLTNHIGRNSSINHREKCQNSQGHYYCAHCNYDSIKKYNLLNHLQCRHSELFGQMFVCKLCGINCKTTYRLNCHLNKQCKQRFPNVKKA